jgi:hypothetical protein
LPINAHGEVAAPVEADVNVHAAQSKLAWRELSILDPVKDHRIMDCGPARALRKLVHKSCPASMLSRNCCVPGGPVT